MVSNQESLHTLIRTLAHPETRERKIAENLLQRYPTRDEVLNAYLGILPEATPQLAVILLAKLEIEGKDKNGVAEKLIPLLSHPDYMVRSKAFISVSRLGDGRIAEKIVDYIASEPGEEWQLRGLECLNILNNRDIVPKLTQFLHHHRNPLLIRGTVWLIGYLGGHQAIQTLAQFAASAASRLVKSEVILEALALAVASVGDGEIYLYHVMKQNPAIARCLRYSKLPDLAELNYGVYPYPDYLALQAEAQGIPYKEFKKLSWWDRAKQGRH